MRFARRIEELPPYLFAEISRKIAEKEMPRIPRSASSRVIPPCRRWPSAPTPEIRGRSTCPSVQKAIPPLAEVRRIGPSAGQA